MKRPATLVSTSLLCLSLTWLAISAGTPIEAGQDPTPEQVTFFETKVRPVLANNCFSCHGPSLQMAGVRLDSWPAIQRAGVVTPGDPDKSRLIQAIRHTGPIKMPQGKKLKADEISALEAWVKMGAPWPKISSGVKPASSPLWSLNPVKRPTVPKAKLSNWAINPIDSFILARLESKGQKPSPAADARTLLRRVTFDLTGLPPTAAEVELFLADKAPGAYERAVDRLLKSPRYGERWARLWLDVARYADTKGYVFEEDRNYYNAYTYRDWVIRAFNEDLPYDQFIVQQLAADRLPEVQNSDDKRALAALGFLTVGRRFLNNPPDIIDDRIDVTMRGFQGFTVSCARCHDHKFDPIPTQDYYSLYGVFASSLEVTTPISDRSIRDPWERYSQRVSAAEKSVTDLVLTQIKDLRQKVKDNGQSVSAEVKQALQMLRENQLPAGEAYNKITKGFPADAQNRLSQLTSGLAEIKKGAPAIPEFAMAMGDSPNPHDVAVFKRGNPNSRGEPAPRRFLAALTKPDAEREHWKSGSGRLELARAIASRENPLTARVLANRLWQHHFGAGLVRTPSDFGHQGEKPTHPELLDYLATVFMENGWSIKKLHRLMVTSATYRQSSSVSKEVFNADPENRNWGRMNRRRLDLEQMRDSLMFASGKLDLGRIGGKSVNLWDQPFNGRRAVYGFVERQNLPGIFKTFDFASPDSTSPRRFMTTVPQQALFFMNSPFTVEQARALAIRPDVQNAKDDAQRIRRIYQLIFARLPDAVELAMATAYLKERGNEPIAQPEGVWRYGYGPFDLSEKRVKSFTPLRHFAEGGYRVGAAFPDPTLGYLILNAQGGHPGRDASLSIIRRWVAPATTTVSISGTLGHRQNQGDGVRAWLVSSRSGFLGTWQAKNNTTKTDIASISVQKGDSLDFVVDCITNEGFDAFTWAPIVKDESGKQVWNASANFGPPPPPPLNRLTLYVQALLMTNEFMFVD